MGKNFKISTKWTEDMGIDLRRCVFLGQGHSGKVYLLPDKRVIKIFKNQESCINEYMILESTRNSRYFPKVYTCFGNYMIRDYVGGICIVDYLRKNRLSKRLAINLIYLIEEFKHLGFTKLDMRCGHIFVQPDESIMVIDPRNHFKEKSTCPNKLISCLKKMHEINSFMDILKEARPDLYYQWKEAV